MTNKTKSGVLQLVVCAAALCCATGAAAQDKEDDEKSVDASGAVAQGAFAPWSLAPSREGVRATAWVLGGYNSASQSAQFRSLAEARVRGPFAFRAGADYDGLMQRARPFIGGRADLLNQSRDGLNLAAVAQFEAVGFNTVPDLELAIALGRTFGRLALIANAAYAQGLQDEERNGSAGLAAFALLNEYERLGLDSKVQIDLERDQDEPEHEPDWRVMAGPVSTTTLNPVSLTVGGGVSALRYRLEPTTGVGATAFASLGLVF